MIHRDPEAMNDPAEVPTVTSRIQERPDLAVGVALLVLLALFWPTLATFPGTWARWNLTHGWLVAAASGWILWRQRKSLLEGPGKDRILLLPLLLLSLVWFVAAVTHTQLVHQTALLGILLLWGLVVLNRERTKILLAVAGLLMLALPLWEGLVAVLRPITSVVSGAMVKMVGIDAVIEGDVIHIAVGSFIVDDGCSGLNYLLAALAIGGFYGIHLARSWRSALMVVGLAGVIAVVGNWIRVAALIVVGHVTEMQSTLILDSHVGFGWALFAVSLVPFLYLAGWIDRLARPTETATPPARATNTGALDAGGSGGAVSEDPGAEDWRSRLLKDRLGPATALAVIGPLVYLSIGVLPDREAGAPGLDGIVVGAAWSAEAPVQDTASAWDPAFQGAEEQTLTTFTDGRTSVRAHQFVYREQSQGAKLIGFPNRIAPQDRILHERVVGPVDPDGRRWVREAIIHTPEGLVLTWYWYRVGGVETFSPMLAKALEVPAFLRRRRTAELLAFSTNCEPESCAAASRSLIRIFGSVTPPDAPTEPREPEVGR